MSEKEATTVENNQVPQTNTSSGADNTQTNNNSTETTSSSTVPTDQAQVSKPLEGPELEEAIIKQVEYYFSPQNLVRDVFLNKQMDKDPNKFVNISVLATFKKLQALTTDTNVIANALRKSNKLTVSDDNEKVRTNNPGSRTILDKTFADREEIQAFFKTILYKYSKDEILREEDRKYVEALLQYHSKKDAKIGCGIKDIKLGNAIGYDDTLCFVVVRTDGTTEDFSYIKCINNLDPTINARKRKQDQQKEKKEKKKQEKGQNEARPPPQKGCIVKVNGLKPELDYRQVKDHYKQFGDVAFVKVEDGTGIVRFKTPEAATNALSDSTKFTGESSTLELLAGEEEESFLAQIPVGNPKAFRGRGRGRGRGGKRQKN